MSATVEPVRPAIDVARQALAEVAGIPNCRRIFGFDELSIDLDDLEQILRAYVDLHEASQP